MAFAHRKQKWQDWFTQQWAITWGQKIDPADVPWLLGPFGQLNGIGETFIDELSRKEHLIIERNSQSGLLTSIHQLDLPDHELSKLSPLVVNFYENTAAHDLKIAVEWNAFFKPLGIWINQLFSNRISQLHIPTGKRRDNEAMISEIVTLKADNIGAPRYTIWLRKLASSNQVMYAGVYGTCTLPSGQTCIKAVFPLPHGNATVIMQPSVGTDGELILNGSGKKFGDPGFYFLLKDTKGNYWSQYIASFQDRLTIRTNDNATIAAEQVMSLWGQRVLRMSYYITRATHWK